MTVVLFAEFSMSFPDFDFWLLLLAHFNKKKFVFLGLPDGEERKAGMRMCALRENLVTE